MDIVTLAAARRLIYNAIAGLDGPIAGKNCKIQSVEDITGGHRITFSWNDDEGVARTSTLDVMDGRGIESVEIKYAASSSGTTPPDSGWSSTVPSVQDGYYLWTRNTLTFSDGSTEIEYLVGKQGFSPIVAVTNIPGGHRVTITDQTSAKQFDVMDGLAIDHITVEYAEGDSGTTPPPNPSDWQNSPPVVAAGNYLWTRNTTYLEDNTTSVAYMVALQGAAGISPDVETTQLPNGTLVNITDKDGPHSFTIYNGEDGTDGRDGADGQDGFSPIITTDKVGKTTTITIVDATGTSYATILDGVDGKTITNITINSNNHVIVTYSDGTSSDAGELIVQSAVMSVNGQTGDVVLDAEDVGALPDDTPLFSGDYNDLTNKPNLATVATSGDYDDLTNKPTIPAAQIQSDWNQSDNTQKDFIKNKPTIPSAQIQSDWNQSDNTQKDFIKNKPTLGTASAKNSTSSVIENSTDLVESGAVKTAIDSAISRVYKPAGNKTVAELTSALLIAGNLGNVYNMTTSGETTSDFVEGAGKPIDVGANVAIVDVGTSSTPSYKFDLLSGMVDMSNFVQKSNTAGLLKNDGTVDTTEYNGKITVSNDTSALTDSDSFDETSAGANPTSTKRRLLSSLWTYIKGKITGAISGIVDSNLTVSRALVSDSNGKVTVSDVTSTELSYLDGVTDNIQTQLDGKVESGLPTDSILHYSFDEVPDIPDGNNVVFNNKDFSLTDWHSSDGTISVDSEGRLKVRDITGLAVSFYKDNLYDTDAAGKTCLMKIYVEKNCQLVCLCYDGNEVRVVSELYSLSIGWNIVNIDIAISPVIQNNLIFNIANSYSSDCIIEWLYIGDLSYKTPGIDNQTGVYNYNLTKSYSIPGLSGKAIGNRGYGIETGCNSLAGNFSLSFWSKNEFQEYYPILICDETDNTAVWLKIQDGIFNKFDISISWPTNDSGRYGYMTIYNGTRLTSQWTHIALSNNNGIYKIYINGILVATYTCTAYKNNAIVGSIYLLKNTTVTICKKMVLDDFQIFDRALSDNEILALYTNRGNTPKYYTLADYENEQLSQSKADKVSNATNGHLASLDSNGNLTDSGKSASDFLPSDTPIPAAQVNSDWNSASGVSQILNKPTLGTASSKNSTSSVTSGSTDLVESGAVADKIQNVIDIASSLPTDAVLHYSFDEVPDLPDSPAIYRRDYNWTTSTWASDNNNTTYSATDGIAKWTTTSSANCQLSNTFSTLAGMILKIKFRASIKNVRYSFIGIEGSTFNSFVSGVSVSGWNEVSALIPSTYGTRLVLQFQTGSSDVSVEIAQIYIGDGSYSTPVIDNANGENNGKNNGGLAIQGLSGKGVYFPNAIKTITSIRIPAPTSDDNFTISCWINKATTYANDSQTTTKGIVRIGTFQGLFGLIRNKSNVGCEIRDSSGSKSILVNTENGKFYHIVGVYSGTTHRMELYINGVLEGKTGTVSAGFQFGSGQTSWTIWGNTQLGGPVADTTNQPAIIDDVLFFDRALSEKEVQALYQNKANTPKYYTKADLQLPQKQDSTLSTPITIGGQTYTTVESALSALAAQLT